MKCPRCGSKDRQCKVGFNPSGSQKYRCYECGKNYTPKPNSNRYPVEADSKQSNCIWKAIVSGVFNDSWKSTTKVWQTGLKNTQSDCPMRKFPKSPRSPNWMSFLLLLARKKHLLCFDGCRSRNSLYLELGCGQRTHFWCNASLFGSCSRTTILQWRLSRVWHLVYGAPYELRNDKKETYSVEGVNAELRHYLKRLARRSRCFSRCPYALKCAIRLLVFCYNQRQLWKHLYHAYPVNLIDFLYTQVKTL